MFVWLWIAGVIAFYFSWRSRRSLREAGVTTGARSIISTQLTEILGVYLAVGLLFLAIAFWMNTAEAPDPTLRALWDFQKTLQRMSAIAGKLKLPGTLASGMMLVLALCAWRNESEVAVLLYGWLSRYQRVVKRVALVATAFASFTLFSGTLDEGQAQVDAQIRSLSDHYAEYVAELHRTANDSVTGGAIVRISDGLPPQWKAVNDREAEIWTRAEDLNRIINSLNQDHGVKVDFRGKRPADGRPAASEAAEPAKKPPPAPDVHQPAPPEAGDFTEAKIASLRANLNERRNGIWQQAAGFLRTQMGAKVPDSLVSDLLSHTHWQALHVLGHEYPLLEALLGVLEKAITGEVSERIKQAVFRLAGDANVTDPASALAAAAENAKPVDWSPAAEALERANRQSRIELGQLDAALKQCQRIETQVIAEEAAAFHARETALSARWREIAGGGPETDPALDFRLQAIEPSSPDRLVPLKSPFARYRYSLRDDTTEAANAFIESLHEPGVTQGRREAAMSAAEAVVAGQGTAQEKAAELGKLTFVPVPRDPLDVVSGLGRGLSGFLGDDFASVWQNAREREYRAQVEKQEEDRRIWEESRRIRDMEHAQFKAEYGYDIDEVGGVSAVKGIRIGEWELPDIPWRALSVILMIE
jgi:hypothetical protein